MTDVCWGWGYGGEDAWRNTALATQSIVGIELFSYEWETFMVMIIQLRLEFRIFLISRLPYSYSYNTARYISQSYENNSMGIIDLLLP